MDSVESEAPATECDYCGGELEPEEVSSGTCDPCWYGMRLEPERWKKRLKVIGREPKYQGGCVPVGLPNGGAAILCRNGYAPGGKKP